jgi:hypothetical protein
VPAPVSLSAETTRDSRRYYRLAPPRSAISRACRSRHGGGLCVVRPASPRRKLNEGADVLNTVIRIVGQRYRFDFADVWDRFAGHGVCSTNPWINGPSVPTSVRPYHPTQTGHHDGYLNALDATTAHRSTAALNWTRPAVA